MLYNPPKLSTLISRCNGDLESRTAQKTLVAEALASMVAGSSYGLHQHIDYVKRQIFPHTADEQGLLEHCRFWRIHRKAPTTATGLINVTTAGVVELGAGEAKWQRRDGVIYRNTESVIITDNTTTIKVVALETGVNSNALPSTSLSLVSPVINLLPYAVVATGAISGGADMETLDSLLTRLMYRVHYPPSGGSEFDYVRWALECPGVTRAWCYPAEMGRNLVTVLFVLDDNPASILPTQADIDQVSAHLHGHINQDTGQWEGKPPCVELIVQAPAVRPLNPRIKLFPDSVEHRTNVATALRQMLSAVAPGGKIHLSQLHKAIANVVPDYKLLSPVDDVQLHDVDLIALGYVLWQ